MVSAICQNSHLPGYNHGYVNILTPLIFTTLKARALSPIIRMLID